MTESRLLLHFIRTIILQDEDKLRKFCDRLHVPRALFEEKPFGPVDALLAAYIASALERYTGGISSLSCLDVAHLESLEIFRTLIEKANAPLLALELAHEVLRANSDWITPRIDVDGHYLISELTPVRDLDGGNLLLAYHLVLWLLQHRNAPDICCVLQLAFDRPWEPNAIEDFTGASVEYGCAHNRILIAARPTEVREPPRAMLLEMRAQILRYELAVQGSPPSLGDRSWEVLSQARHPLSKAQLLHALKMSDREFNESTEWQFRNLRTADLQRRIETYRSRGYNVRDIARALNLSETHIKRILDKWGSPL